MFKLTERDFKLLSALVYHTIGINLGPAKKELVRTRLGKRLQALGISSFKDYYRHVTKVDQGELRHLFDAVSTNLTSFFREKPHFDFLANNLLPDLVEEKRKKGSSRIRGWSAACSTGEEPYSIAMTLSDYLGETARWDIRILATDINTEVLEKAETGVYSEKRVKDLPRVTLRSHFLRGDGGKQGYVKVKKDLQDMVVFKRFNLAAPSYPFKREFDFIFCRNVMIYFDKTTQKLIIDRMYAHLKAGGYLFLGHAESLTGIDTPFEYIRPTIYLKR